MTPLIELFTSEGCSSCPPADRWLSALPERGYGPQRVVPLAFHVDYWDDLGWKDRFASREYSQRQREAAARRRSSTVYTPQVMVNGRDFRTWHALASFHQAVERVAATESKAAIRLVVERGAGGRAAVQAEAGPRGASLPSSAALYVAYFESGHVSDVNAGENRGERLGHDNVVRRLVGPERAGPDGRMRISAALPERDSGAGGAGVAAFVQDLESGEVLQALALARCL